MYVIIIYHDMLSIENKMCWFYSLFTGHSSYILYYDLWKKLICNVFYWFQTQFQTGWNWYIHQLSALKAADNR